MEETITDQRISKPTAIIAHEKGFNEPDDYGYCKINPNLYRIESTRESVDASKWNNIGGYSAPTQSHLHTWIRKHFKKLIIVFPIVVKSSETSGFRYSWSITDLSDVEKEDIVDGSALGHLKYEDAYEAALIEAMKN